MVNPSQAEMANYHPIKRNCLFSLPSWYVFTLLGERERKRLKMLCLCTLCSAHWLFAFSIIYPRLEDFFQITLLLAALA